MSYVAPRKHWADEYHAGQVVCLPIAMDQDLRGVLVVEAEPGDVLPASAIEPLQLACDLCGPVLARSHDTGRWVGARLWAWGRRTAAVVVGPEHTWVKLAAIALSAAVVFLVVAKGAYRIDAPFVMETATRYVVAAPFEEKMLTLSVLPGDHVRAGQELAVMRTSELRESLAGLLAERRVASEEADTAARDQAFGEHQIAMARVDQADAQISLLRMQLDQATIVAPVDGVVVEGDLRRRVHGRFEDAEPMFEVAPIDALRATVMVLESQVSEVHVGMRGELAAAAEPSSRIGFTVTRVEPLARLEDGNNVFPVWVELDEQPPWVMAGMEGVAKIDVDRRRYAWIWTRSAVNWVRMRLWF